MPDRIGRHEILLPLGEGETSTVYLGRAVAGAGFQRLAAIKVLHAGVITDPVIVDRFLESALASARIAHPNVVAVHDVGADEGIVHAVMDYVEGDTLAAVAAAAEAVGRRIPLNITPRVVLDALAGLHAAHELCDDDGVPVGAIHGDVSPRHVLLGVDGTSRLIDFGVRPDHGGTTTPEELAGVLPDRRTDVYATARMLWEAVTLEPMFPGFSPADRARRTLQGRYRPLAHFDPETPPVLDAICERGMKVDPTFRYPTAAAFADAIEENLRGYLASHREVATFIQGVAATRIAREREAVRLASRGDAPFRDMGNHPGIGDAPDGPGDISGMRKSTTLRPEPMGFAEMSTEIPYIDNVILQTPPPEAPPHGFNGRVTDRFTPLPLVFPTPVADADGVTDEDRARFSLPSTFQRPPVRNHRGPAGMIAGIVTGLVAVGCAVWLVLQR